jgi:hypothetical protein
VPPVTFGLGGVPFGNEFEVPAMRMRTKRSRPPGTFACAITTCRRGTGLGLENGVTATSFTIRTATIMSCLRRWASCSRRLHTATPSRISRSRLLPTTLCSTTRPMVRRSIVARQRNVKFVIGSSLNAAFISGSPRYNYGKTSRNISHQYLEKRERLRARGGAVRRRSANLCASVLCGTGRRRGVDRRRVSGT